MVASGCTVSPPITATCLRSGWSIVKVKERYFKYEATGNQYVGRCSVGLNHLTKGFSVSPPHFEFSHLDYRSAVNKELEIEK